MTEEWLRTIQERNEAEADAKQWRRMFLTLLAIIALVWFYAWRHPHDPNAPPDDPPLNYFTD